MCDLCYISLVISIINLKNYFMEADFTTVINGKIYCNYCSKILKAGEECSCKSSQKAHERAKEKAKKAAIPKHNDLPPRRRWK